MTNEQKKYVYSFTEGDGKARQLLGGKGANLCEMTQIGLNVPPGYTITTEACLSYLENDNTYPDGLMQEVREQMIALEKLTGKGFGDAHNPLLVSVRSGSAMSMPGMMDTILNLGMNSDTLQGEIEQTGDERFAYDAYRRFIQLFGKVALGIDDEYFDEPFEAIKKREGVKEDVGLSTDNLKEIATLFLEVVHAQTGRAFPEDPYEQLDLAIKAVLGSWSGKRAVDYRREFNITPDQANGTAVNICTMVFGNRGDDCATGVAFTRNPGTGENVFYGEYLVNAQGEDVVAGIRTPKPIAQMADEMPDLYRQLEELRSKLENHYSEIQDFEFTIEKGILYCLQTRNGKMNTQAMVRTSVELVEEGLITKDQALMRIAPESLEQMLFPRLDPNANVSALATGLPASPGAACGHVVFDADRAVALKKTSDKPLILLREETKPEDIHGFFVSEAILTSRGGKTSHAAVVARGMGKPCVAGADGIEVDVMARRAHIGEVVIKEGDIITLDGTSGNVYLGAVATVEAEFSDELKTLLSWADERAQLKVMANADIPEDAERALKYGAMGIGLCRTERMFNAADRLPIVLEMIVSDTLEQRQDALDKLLPIQRQDFIELFSTMSPRPVTVRLLDPPIHEFLPSENQLIDDLVQLKHLKDTMRGSEVLTATLSLLSGQNGTMTSIQQLADSSLVDEAIEKKEAILKKVRALFEVNPMLGHRGVRLGITFPEIYAMQIRAVLEAACECQKAGIEVHPEIMIPQVCTSEELRNIKVHVENIRLAVEEEQGIAPVFKFGSMMEVVRACMRAEQLAEEAEFFSFGTNDLTQATFSFSREDAENKFLPMYNEAGILQDNPFEVLDANGVGKIMELAVNWGRGVKPGMKIGICGEHGGHPASIGFCHSIGLTYVSCSGPRVPIARLAAAQAALQETA
ncbi:pyruvate, orthophosphate dikinase [Mariprofundus micogutta]|uniref:Pyruvate, phosphate dikinase n=1 Tax=Mariprofundus micogutta TaxID=1921010 RepID=A0A1L8CNG0_9PROT|nr:pyruvate, phosphate dikinase [Mariprofundus micogutta]GAV20433.1 pyruvate, orthophosphate dikinase [Mariprofundus micogutta]